MNCVSEGGQDIAANADQKQPSAASSAAWWPSENNIRRNHDWCSSQQEQSEFDMDSGESSFRPMGEVT